MNYVGQLAESVYVTVKELYEGLNPATLSGGIDVLVVKQPDGSFLCSPFHVRFGKLGVLRSREKVVDIEINGEPVDLQMKLGDDGEAFFVQQLETNDEEIPTNLYTSPIPPECSNEVLNDPLLDLIENVHKHSSETTMSQRKKRRRRKKVKKKDKLMLTTTPATSSEELEEVQAEIVVEDRPMTELSPTPDQTEEDISTQHKDSHLYLNMEAIHKESFYTAEDELIETKDSFICSDVEFSRNESLSSEYLTSIRSDSELEIKFGSQNAMRTEPQMQWHWGRLPQVVKGEHMKLMRSSHSNTSINPLLCEESICQIAASDPLANSETILQDAQNISGAPSLLKLPSYSESTSPLGLIKFCPSTKQLTDSQVSLAQNSEEGRTENIQETDTSFDSTMLPQGLTGQEGSDSSRQKKERKDTQRRSQHQKSSDTYLEGLSSLNSATFPQSEINLQAQQWNESFSESNLLHPNVVGDEIIGPLSDASLEQENNVELSLCGGLAENRNISTEKFAKYAVSYKNFADNPGILDDPNLVVKIGKKYYNWAVAAPMILSLQAFQKSLPKSTVDKLVKEKMPKKTGRWWFSWGIKDSASEKNEVQEVASTSKKDSMQQGQKENSTIEEDPLSIPVVLDSPSPPQSSFPNFKKSLRLSSDQLRDLNLREGANDVVFSVTTQYQGTCRCHANIYLWNWYDKVVVSDIDGTITRSDALGHILPQLGKDWTHRGIIKLYHKIHLNGYKFLYCSARSIGMADLTKGYLKWVHEHDCGLPKGPLLLTPSSLFSALHREVIEKKPEVFKIACLTDIRNLFLPHGDPFFAGFGNRASDVDAYLQAGISKSRIFTINPQGELIQEHIKNHKTTYDRLRECVELIFPPIKLGPSVELVKPEYSQFCYWRNPLVKVHPRDLVLD
ncbi:phosphatidate phosphatase LPIN3 isoform X2 [Antechinus flavipes]|uniref:phosphatidate phosphatase LPIN3 isoform X2 n=1 Tax=Antechinus flavipes TaxID=38775 RepID=UPI002235E054|nr:phosphatidate phosphatase LPIN3 isoform X2 [Antechinus flavipes]